MKYADRQSIYNHIIVLTKLIEGGPFAAEVRHKPSRKRKRIIHYFDTHTISQCKAELERLEELRQKITQ